MTTKQKDCFALRGSDKLYCNNTKIIYDKVLFYIK